MRVASLRFFTVCALLAGAFGASYWLFRSYTLRAQVATIRPFTATVMDMQYYGPENIDHKRVEYYTVAVRSDGSEVESYRRRAPDGTWNNSRTITDPSTGKRVFVDDLTQSTSTVFLSGRALVHVKAQTAGCAAMSSAKTANILGYRAVEAHSYSGLAAHGTHFVRDAWLAPDLDCLVLQDTSTWSGADGATIGEHIIKTLTVTVGEPAATLFNMPTNYTERSPGEILKIFAARFHRTDHPETDARVDNFYYASRGGSR